jgi:hypothetical protein
VGAQLKLDTVQQLGELVAGDIERKLFSGKAIVVQETTAVVPVFRRVALIPPRCAPYQRSKRKGNE